MTVLQYELDPRALEGLLGGFCLAEELPGFPWLYQLRGWGADARNRETARSGSDDYNYGQVSAGPSEGLGLWPVRRAFCREKSPTFI